MASTQHQMQAARETGADPDSGAMGDLHAADWRAERRRMVDALGTRARRSRPSAAVSRAIGPCGRESAYRRPQRAESRAGTAGIVQGCRAACGLAVSGAGRAEWTKRYPRYPQAISGALRALQRGNFVLIGSKKVQMRRIQVPEFTSAFNVHLLAGRPIRSRRWSEASYRISFYGVLVRMGWW